MNHRSIVLSIGVVMLAIFAAIVFLRPQSAEPPAREVTGPSGDTSTETGQSEGTLVRPHSPYFGPADAPVTIVEFFDPSCEACRAFYPIVKEILDRYPDQVRLVLRYTLFHRGSEEVSRLVEAARLQEKYQPVLEAVLEAQPMWHDDPAVLAAWQAAEAAGLDVEKAREDMQSEDIDAILEIDTQDVEAFEVRRTPTFFVNGKPLTEFGARPLLQLVLAELEAATE